MGTSDDQRGESRWLPDRPIKLMGDTAYSVLELGLHAQHQQVTLVTTGRLDAVLHEPPPQRSRHTIGRPRVVGLRLPALEQVLQDPETVWQKLTLDWHGEVIFTRIYGSLKHEG